jgi:hypothetical protein
MGNLATAEAHMDGLLSLVELQGGKEFQEDYSHNAPKFDSDVLDRYILICIHEIFNLKMSLAHNTTSAMLSRPRYTRGGVTPMSQLDHRLLALWMIPYFLTDSTDLRVNDINGAEFLSSPLRHWTEGLGACRVNRSRKQDLYLRQNPNQFSSGDNFLNSGDKLSMQYLCGLSENGSAIRITASSTSSMALEPCETLTTIDRGLLSFPPPEASFYDCSWFSCASIVGIYMYTVMDVAWSLEATNGRHLRWILHNLYLDIKKTQAASEFYQISYTTLCL